MQQIKFTHNWNYKLFTKHFTTIRLYSKKWKVGQVYEMQIPMKSGNPITKQMKLVSATPVKLDSIPEFTWYTDTGYNKAESIQMIKNMYSKYKIDVFNAWFSILVFEQDIEY